MSEFLAFLPNITEDEISFSSSVCLYFAIIVSKIARKLLEYMFRYSSLTNWAVPPKL